MSSEIDFKKILKLIMRHSSLKNICIKILLKYLRLMVVFEKNIISEGPLKKTFSGD